MRRKNLNKEKFLSRQFRRFCHAVRRANNARSGDIQVCGRESVRSEGLNLLFPLGGSEFGFKSAT
jgi:hypothetical protein